MASTLDVGVASSNWRAFRADGLDSLAVKLVGFQIMVIYAIQDEPLPCFKRMFFYSLAKKIPF